jgi:hypothetical protein
MIIVNLGIQAVEDALPAIWTAESVIEQNAEALCDRRMTPNFESKSVRKHFIPKNENLDRRCTFDIKDCDTNGTVTIFKKQMADITAIKHVIKELRLLWV